jgi:DNA-binding FadR family transcriptional regulator
MRDFLDRARRMNISQLPPEPRLAEEIGVTRSRLRVLLKRMESENLIWRQVGKGTFLGERTMTSNLAALPDRVSPVEALEARIGIEPQLAALAAQRASPLEIEEMQSLHARMSDIKAIEQWSECDRRLHRLVAKAARNTLLLVIYDIVRESVPRDLIKRQLAVLGTEARGEANAEHAGYIDAIAQRDPQSAERLMREHLISVRRSVLGEI